MLRFLYTDKMENANIHAKELLRAANKYNIPRMKLLAEEALCQNLSDDTVLLVAKFANVHNGGYAKDFAINCIVSNFGTLIRRPEWADFIKENPDLLHEIHLRISSKMDNGQRHGRSSTTISRYSTSWNCLCQMEAEYKPRKTNYVWCFELCVLFSCLR